MLPAHGSDPPSEFPMVYVYDPAFSTEDGSAAPKLLPDFVPSTAMVHRLGLDGNLPRRYYFDTDG